MIKKIGEIEFNIPDSINELTLEQYSILLQDGEKTEIKEEDNDEDSGLKMLADWFCKYKIANVTFEDLEDLPFFQIIEVRNTIVQNLNKSLKPSKKKVVTIDGRNFYIPNNNGLTFGDVKSIEGVLKANDNKLSKAIPVIVAILFREKNETGDRKKLEKRIEDIEEDRLNLFREKLLVKDFVEPFDFFLTGIVKQLNTMSI